MAAKRVTDLIAPTASTPCCSTWTACSRPPPRSTRGLENDVRRVPRRRAAEGKEPFRPFDIATDYKRYVDGKPRYEGVRSFLESRNISLAEGTPEDPPTDDTVCGLGNRKDELVKEAIDRGEVEAYPGSVALVRRLREQGFRTAVVSSSRNCEPCCGRRASPTCSRCGWTAWSLAELDLPGKPAPDTFLKAAEMLGRQPGPRRGGGGRDRRRPGRPGGRVRPGHRRRPRRGAATPCGPRRRRGRDRPGRVAELRPRFDQLADALHGASESR